MEKKEALIVLSGGMDSVTMLYEYQEEIALAVSFDYGANHNARELPFAEWHCRQLNIPHLIVPLDFMHRYFNSSLFGGADAVPEGNYDDQNMKSTVVPFRNGIMLAIACGMAESRELSRVMLANHSGDHAIYPDCRPEFIRSMSDAMKFGTYNSVTICAPYTGLTKAEICKRGAQLGVDYTKTWSCYKGQDVHCGRCGTCTERRGAFRKAGVPDPTVYEP